MDVEKISVDGFNLNVSDAKARDMISDKYDPDNGTYVVGDTCINDDVLYICNTDIDTPEDFDSSKWDADTVGHYCSELKSNLTWKKVMDVTSTTAVDIDLSDYNEVMLCLKLTSDNLLVSSDIYPVSVANTITVNTYFYHNNLKFGRISNNGTKAVIGDTSYPMIVYAR